jgi:hypothetical protein
VPGPFEERLADIRRFLAVRHGSEADHLIERGLLQQMLTQRIVVQQLANSQVAALEVVEAPSESDL